MLAALCISHSAQSAERPSSGTEAAKTPALDVPFIISYWCGPPKSETTLERYKEIAECGFNVTFPAIDLSKVWDDTDVGPANDAHNLKVLDLCRQVGIKAMIFAGMPLGDWSAPTPEEVLKIQKSLDAKIAKFSSHPALCS